MDFWDEIEEYDKLWENSENIKDKKLNWENNLQ